VTVQVHPSERGATAVEYALMAALIAIVIVTAVTALGTAVSSLFADAAGMF
jgi:pilus assembly protein Flp/PilA